MYCRWQKRWQNCLPDSAKTYLNLGYPTSSVTPFLSPTIDTGCPSKKFSKLQICSNDGTFPRLHNCKKHKEYLR